MGEKLTKAILEQEGEMNLGIPDESVNLSFEDLAKETQNPKTLSEWEKSIITIESNPSVNGFDHQYSKKIPSFDFSKALQHTIPNYNIHQHHPFTSTNLQHHHHHHIGHQEHNNTHISGHHVQGHNGRDSLTMHHDDDHHHHHQQQHGVQNMGYQHHHDMSNMSMASMYQEITGIRRRRAGIPHSSICTICSNYVYVFQHRCLVCGRVYCRNCVSIGMGEMVEGRKCTECLGRRFSQRYIERAGEVGCCFSRYPYTVRQAELKWAEMGSRRVGERALIRSAMISALRSPIPEKSPKMAHSSSNPNSFVMSSSNSPYTPTHRHLPF